VEQVAAGVSLGRQVLRRHVNERVRADGPRDGTVIEVLCECGRVACADRIRIASDAYGDVAATPGRYLVSAAHASEEARFVGAANGYVVLERDGAV
jgi:hypothetical protein